MDEVADVAEHVVNPGDVIAEDNDSNCCGIDLIELTDTQMQKAEYKCRKDF